MSEVTSEPSRPGPDTEGRAPSRPASRQGEEEPSEPEEAAVPARPTDRLKRVVDVLCALIGFLLTAPAWLVLPVWIKLEDGGPVFHAQQRVGKGGELFTSWKFRSMRPRPEEDGPPAQAEVEADRVTRAGAFMRPCALDELPQLWNILKGDMSLVGPRALLPEEVEHRSEEDEPVRLADLPGYGKRHSVRPGLTGLAQIQVPRDVPHGRKFRYDIFYVENRTLGLDLKLIVYSVVISLLGRWPEVGRGDG